MSLQSCRRLHTSIISQETRSHIFSLEQKSAEGTTCYPSSILDPVPRSVYIPCTKEVMLAISEPQRDVSLTNWS